MSLFELVATGPQAGQRWRQTLSAGHRVRIGRAPAKGWAVSWDMRISREHFDVELESEQLKVKCLDSALNPAHVAGQSAREFTINEGESFRIGATNFHFGRQVPALDDDTSRPSVFPPPKAQPPAAEAPQKPKPPVVEQDPSGIRHLKDEVQQLKAQLAAEAQRRVVEEAKRISAEKEAERFAAEAEAKRIASEQEAKRRAEELAQRIAAENEAKRLANEAEARRQAEEAKRLAAEAEAQRLATEAKARQVAQAEEDSRRPREETRAISSERETKVLTVEADAQRLEEAANRIAAEAEAKRLAEEAEARRIADEEAKRLAEEAEARRREEEAKRKAAEAEAKAKRIAEEAEARRREEEAKRLAEEAEARRREEEAKRKAAEAEAKRIAEEAEARRIAEEKEAKRKAKELADRIAAEKREAKRLADEAETRRLAEEAKRMAAEAQRLAEAAEARRLALEAEAQREVEEESQRLAASEEEERRTAEEADAKRRADEVAKRLAAEEEERLAAEEAITKRRAEAKRIAEEEEKRAEEAAQAKRAADQAEAKRQADEEVIRIALEEEAVRRASEAQVKVTVGEADFGGLANQLEQERAKEAEQCQQTEEAARKAAEATPPKTPHRKPNVAELKAQLAAEAAAKRQAKGAKPAPSDEQAERPGESPKPAVKGELQNLKAQLASQAAAKKQERAAAAAPTADVKDPVHKKLDLGALKAELEAKKAAKQNNGSDVVPPPGVGQASEDKYVDRLAAQLNAQAISAQDLQTSTIKPTPRPAELAAHAAKSLQGGKAPLGVKPAPRDKLEAKPPPKGKEVAAASGDDPKKFVWQLLPENVRESIRRIASGKEATPEEKLQITNALNQLAKDREFLGAKALEKSFENARVADGIKSFPKGLKGIKKDWSELEVRAGASLVLQSLYPTTRTKKRKRKVGLPRTLAYLSRSDIFGEIGALLNQSRSATCIAYDHPPDDPSRKPGRVELVRIGIEVFRELLDSSPGFRAKMESLIAERQHRSRQAVEERPWDQNSSLKSLPEFQQLGLVQGQKLMLIDLDRCTRCGDCVRACINTHDDGYSRLFLDGPRFDRFLVPSACRKCLNPSCMIGCPVGSIQRGANDEIVIRDWCIGCSLCARQCPYDSIQMHDLGIIPEKAIGWRFQLASNVTQQNWNQSSFRESNWSSGTGPFAWDLNLQIPLSGQTTTFLGPTLEEGVYFRYQFEIPKDKQRSATRYRLFLVSNGSAAEVWVNGQAVELPQDAKQRKKGEYEGNLPASLIRSGKNVVAVSIQPSISFGETVLSLRLDMPPELTGDAALANELKLVTERAVVCDMCSSRPGGEPACVAECPHDAAMRVDAQHDFPRN